MGILITQRYLKWTAAGVVWLISFSVYCATLATSVGYIDSGELAAVANTLGIAHPTGYPLYTLLGRIFSILPVAGEVIVRLNILSALLTSGAAVVFYFTVLALIESEKNDLGYELVGVSAVASLLLAFSTTFWLQGVSAEVYALHLFMVNGVLLSFIHAVKTDEPRWWILFAYVTGLSFTNHMTTILLAPALIFWFFAEHGAWKDAFKKIVKLSMPFLAGLSVYLYLPIRAMQSPLLNWGNPQSFEKFWWHVTGKQFRIWMFSSGDVAKKQLEYFSGNISNEFHTAVLVVALIGAAALLFSRRRKFIVVMLLFVTCIAYSVNYDIHDIDSYFLLAYIAVGIFAACGALLIMRRFEQRTGRVAALSVFAGLVIVQAAGNWASADQSQNHMVEDYAMNILTDLPPNALVLSTQWDYFVSASYYFRHVNNVRPDIVVLDKELFRRSWYFPQLKGMYPEVIRKSEGEYSAFMRELYKFEHDLPYDYNAIEGTYTALLSSFIEKHAPFPVFITPEIEPQYLSGYIRVPEGFLFRLTRDTTYQPAPFPRIAVREYHSTDSYTRSLRMIMRNALLYRASYEQYYGRDTLSALFNKKASEFTAN